MKQRIPLIPAVYLVIRRGDEILLSRRKNTGWRDGMLALVSGHIEDREKAVAAAIRELKEEVGVDAEPEDLDFIHVVHRMAEEEDHERLDLFFEITKWQGEVENKEPHKCDELVWSSIDDLPEDVIPMVKEVLKNYRKPAFYSELDYF